MNERLLHWDWDWVAKWTIVLLCNLPVPIMLGLMVTPHGGFYGICIGVLVIWFFGLACGYLPKPIRKSILISGILTAISQFIPWLQFIAGFLAASSLDWTTGLNLDSPHSLIELTGIAITILTGQILILFSTIITYVTITTYSKIIYRT
jgi:multisubunit Na+/H+ antiporter MnhB subunit